jgi:hypothetical protein
MERLRARVKDKRVLALVKSFLKAGVLTEIRVYEDSCDRHRRRRSRHRYPRLPQLRAW